jgi:hypothetical protein
MTYGASTLVLFRSAPGYLRVRLVNSGTSISWPPATSWAIPAVPIIYRSGFQITVITDPNLKSMVVDWYGNEVLVNHYLAGNGPAVVRTTPPARAGSPAPFVTVTSLPSPAGGNMNLCRSLLPNR